MPKLKTLTLAIAAVFMVTGCASTHTSMNDQSPNMQPVQRVTHGSGNPQALYQLGRYYQGQARYELALRAYREALSLQPRYVDALTGMGVVYANLGQYDTSLRLLVAAAALDPGSVSTRNNLGYIHWLRDERDAALAAYRQALKLDPMNASARANLREIMKDAANDRPATRLQAPADAATRASVSAAPRPQLAPQVYELQAPTHGVPTAIAPAAGVRVAMKAIAPQVYELGKPGEAKGEPAPASRAVADKPREQSLVADAIPTKLQPLEVANGNGVKGIARKTAANLSGRGYRATRIYDMRPFDKAVTRLEYRRGYEFEALKLGAELPGKVVYVESNALRGTLRLVVGHDVKNDLAWSQWLESVRLAKAGSAPRL